MGSGADWLYNRIKQTNYSSWILSFHLSSSQLISTNYYSIDWLDFCTKQEPHTGRVPLRPRLLPAPPIDSVCPHRQTLWSVWNVTTFWAAVSKTPSIWLQTHWVTSVLAFQLDPYLFILPKDQLIQTEVTCALSWFSCKDTWVQKHDGKNHKMIYWVCPISSRHLASSNTVSTSLTTAIRFRKEQCNSEGRKRTTNST